MENEFNESVEVVETFLELSKKIRKVIDLLLINELSRNPNLSSDLQLLSNLHNRSAICFQQIPKIVEKFQLTEVITEVFLQWEKIIQKLAIISNFSDSNGNIYAQSLNCLSDDLKEYRKAIFELETEINAIYYLDLKE